MRNRSVPLFVAAAFLAPAALLLPACKQGDAPAAPTAPAPIPVRVTPARTGVVDLTVESVGTVRAVESVTLAVKVSGLVREVLFDEGSLVDEGQTLVTLDDSLVKAERASRRAARDRAAREIERLTQARRTGAATTKELDDAQLVLDQAQAEYDAADVRVSDHQLVAPFSGRVGMRLVSPGAFLAPGDAVTSLHTVDPMEIEFAVPEQHLAALGVGQPVAATSRAYPGREFQGQVKVIGPAVDPSTRAITLLADIPNPDGLLKPGMFMGVRLVVGRRENSILIPEQAITVRGDTASVWLVVDNAAERRDIRVGQRRQGVVEVLEGLTEGDLVVVAGHQKLRAGSPVAPERAESAETRN